MSTSTLTSLKVSRLIQAPRQEVFEAWTRPEQLRRWSCPEGATVDDVAVDLRVGGAYRIRMKNPDGEVWTALGTYREIDPPHRLVYTWDWEEEDHQVGETLVTVEFRDRGEATEVVLVHEGFPAAEATTAHEEGWTSCLDRLEGVFS